MNFHNFLRHNQRYLIVFKAFFTSIALSPNLYSFLSKIDLIIISDIVRQSMWIKKKLGLKCIVQLRILEILFKKVLSRKRF